jgi:hypothetical protein
MAMLFFFPFTRLLFAFQQVAAQGFGAFLLLRFGKRRLSGCSVVHSQKLRSAGQGVKGYGILFFIKLNSLSGQNESVWGRKKLGNFAVHQREKKVQDKRRVNLRPFDHGGT